MRAKERLLKELDSLSHQDILTWTIQSHQGFTTKRNVLPKKFIHEQSRAE